MFFQLVTTYIYRNSEVLFPRLGLNAQTGFPIATRVTADRKYENLQYLIQRHKKTTPVPSGSQKKIVLTAQFTLFGIYILRPLPFEPVPVL